MASLPIILFSNDHSEDNFQNFVVNTLNVLDYILHPSWRTVALESVKNKQFISGSLKTSKTQIFITVFCRHLVTLRLELDMSNDIVIEPVIQTPFYDRNKTLIEYSPMKINIMKVSALKIDILNQSFAWLNEDSSDCIFELDVQNMNIRLPKNSILSYDHMGQARGISSTL